jgi:hypothetical protein
MNMDFPHPRRAGHWQDRRGSYARLIAAATSRQMASRTAGMIARPAICETDQPDLIESRIAYFSRSRRLPVHSVFGAFLPDCKEQHAADQSNSESVVYPSGSINRKDTSINNALPAIKPESRGMEIRG